MSDVVCPDCSGSGTVTALVDHFSHKGVRSAEMRATSCSVCGGEGHIPAEQLAMMVEGNQRREDRLARKFSLRQEAARLGIEPSELSVMEFGRKPFPENVK